MLVATPGRLNDFLDSRQVTLSHYEGGGFNLFTRLTCLQFFTS